MVGGEVESQAAAKSTSARSLVEWSFRSLRRIAAGCNGCWVHIGIESEAAVPNGWNIIRFLAVLGQAPHLDLLRDSLDVVLDYHITDTKTGRTDASTGSRLSCATETPRATIAGRGRE